MPFEPQTGATVAPVEAQRFGPGHIVTRLGVHGHHFNEIILFESGSGRHAVGGVSRSVATGDVDALATGQLHDAVDFGDTTGWMLLFHDDAAITYALPDNVLAWFSHPGERQSGRCTLDALGLTRLSERLATIEREGRERKPGFREAIGAEFALVLIDLARKNDTATLPANATVQGHLRRLVAAIDTHLDRPLTLSFLAHELGISGGHLTTEIRRTTGRTVMDWVIARRMREARRRLLETDETIESLAGALNFADASHFARRFRELHALTPTEFRNLGLRKTTNSTDLP